jgi:hypothetical protein
MCGDTALTIPHLSSQLLSGSGITYVSVAHRSTLKRHHKVLLQLDPSSDGDGGAAAVAVYGTAAANMRWSVSPLTPATAATA